MSEPRYRTVAADLILVEPLDIFTAVFHRPSGITHLLSEPAPQIMEALATEPLTLRALADRLMQHYELDGADAMAALRARVDELEAAGLVVHP